MKILEGAAVGLLGAVCALNAFFVVDMGRVALQPVPQPCMYYAETPTGTQAYYGLEDAQGYLRSLGIDPANTPEGYDITSKAGC